MDKRTWNPRTRLVLALTLVSLLGRETLRAAGEESRANQNQIPALDSLRVVDVFNLFPNVGAFLVWGEPNDAGIPEGLVTRCTGTLIGERVMLTAGHCVKWLDDFALPPSSKLFVTFNPNARERSSWRGVAGHVAHPSLPPCPPPDLCTFRGLDPGILDIGLIFLSEPVRGIEPATLARPNTLASDRAEDALMILPRSSPCIRRDRDTSSNQDWRRRQRVGRSCHDAAALCCVQRRHRRRATAPRRGSGSQQTATRRSDRHASVAGARDDFGVHEIANLLKARGARARP